DATGLPCDARHAYGMGQRNDPCAEEHARLYCCFDASDYSVGLDRHMGLLVAVVRRGEPIDGSSQSAHCYRVAKRAKEESFLRVVADVIHVHYDAGRNAG